MGFADLAALDTAGVRVVRGMSHPRALNRAFWLLSRTTDHSDAWLALGLTGAALDRERRAQWLTATGTVALTDMTARAIKRAVPRERPQLEGLPPLAPVPSPRSFPSSHTAAAVAAIDAFGELLPRRVLYGVAAVSAFSRLYLGVHFPSDVAFGAVLGRGLARGRRR